MTEHEELLIAARYQPTTVGNMALDPKGGYCNYQAVEILRQRVQELTAERDKATQYWQIAEGRCDAMMKQRDELLSDVERCYRMLLSEPDTQGALFKAENILREAIASVKEK